ncbi:hypothetical protein PYW08_010975 [Mythimna loreyi]|uniref:Uncharacterized protein n=1 Tax=Mythimna loreyi TaxID=667449 RepID=A0ACC2Q3W7_9NEOP|nr:hypothetical protein PYW08_010975 [Mythimna loreyi]
MFNFILYLIMFCVVLVLSTKLPENEYSGIRLNYTSNYINDTTTYPIWKNKPLNITIEKCYARYIWCNDYIHKNNSTISLVPETEFNTDMICKFNITNVTAEMNTMWKCTVLKGLELGDNKPYRYKNRKYTAKDLYFKVEITGPRLVILQVNDQILNYDVITRSVDGNASYIYEHGEEVELFCVKSDIHSQYTLHLEYFNAEGNLLFKSGKNEMHKFRSVMNSTNNNYYIDCIVSISNQTYGEYRYRTTFYMKKELAVEQRAIILSVNGQNMTTYRNNNKLYDNYVFRYINGEKLNVTCQINMDLYPKGTLSYYVDDRLQNNVASGFVSVQVCPSLLENNDVTCLINNSDEQTPNAALRFWSDVPNTEVRVRGLPRYNILYQYTNGPKQWIIEYQYSVNDTINLTCVSNYRDTTSNPDFEWKHKNKIVPSEVKHITAYITFSKKTFTKKLNASDNGTIIKCTYFPNGKITFYWDLTPIVEVVLRLKPELVSEEKTTEAAFEEKTTEGAFDPKPLEEDPLVAIIVPLSVTVGVALAIITMVGLVCWRKRMKRINLIHNNYDNFSNENNYDNNSQIPTSPSQWDANYDYAHDAQVRQENYSSADDDKLYRLPYKRESNNSENFYHEIDDNFKPKPDELGPNGNGAQSSSYYKNSNTLKGIATHHSNTPIYNNLTNSKVGDYDQLEHTHNVPINKSNEDYSNVQSTRKNKSVTFREPSSDFDRGRNYSEGISKSGCRKHEERSKRNHDGQYANTDQDIVYKQPGDMQKKSHYENDFPLRNKTVTPLDLNPEVLDDDFEISCKNELYGKFD